MKNKLRHHYLYIILLSCTSWTACNGQVSPDVRVEAEAPNYSLLLPESEGQALDSAAQVDDYIVEVFEDNKGNIWFGTIAKGAARYDGKSLTYFSTADGLVDNTVVSMAQDKEGNLWFGTHDGVSRFDGKTFTNYKEPDGLHDLGCVILVDRKGQVWAGTNSGAFRFNGSSFTPFTLPNPVIEDFSYKWVAGKIWCLMEDRKGNIWFGRDGYGACKYDGQSFTHFTTKDGLCSNNVSSIAEDQQGNIWFGSITSDFPTYRKVGGLSRYDGKTITTFPQMKGLTENDIYMVYADKSGDVWIGAIKHGAYRYSKGQFSFFNETDRPDLTSVFGIQGILEDSKGIFWFGFSGGLFRFNGSSFTNITQGGPWPQGRKL
jgi:ligand-binding sensor domain-containing protein